MTDKLSSTETPSQLERDAERVRAQIADTAEHLKDKLSPGQLMDEALAYFKDGDANQLLSNLKTQVRDNPLALALAGGGLAWLMMGSGPSAASRSPVPPRGGSTTPSTHGGARRPAPDGMSASGPSGIGSTAGKGAGTAGGKVSSAAASLGDAASSAADGISERAHDLRDATGEYMASASMAGTRVRNTFLDTLEREPLVLGALGVAVGAAIGAMLPPMRAEQEYLGPATKQARDAAEDALAEGMDKARQVASDVYSAAKSEADRQGLVSGEESVTERVTEVAQAAGDELKSVTGTVRKPADGTAGRTTDKGSPDTKPPT